MMYSNNRHIGHTHIHIHTHIMQKRQTHNAFQHILEERIKSEVEIYYESSVHKKFLADVYAVIPKGRKCVIWFTNHQCWMFQIAKRPYTPTTTPGGPRNVVLYDMVRMINLPFTNEAWYAGKGTIIYGTCVSEKQKDVQRRFSVENVYYFCGEKQPDNGALGRFVAFFDAYAQETKSKSNHQFQLFMPIMHANFNDAVRDARVITTYDVFCIQHRFVNRACNEFKNLCMDLIEPVPADQRGLSFFPNQANVQIAQPQPQRQTQTPMPIQRQPQRQTQTREFMIRPDAQNDIYYVLHNQDEPITANTMIAHIPNYKTSVMMNSLFRNIKENRNLDALEESDDEDETLTPLVDLNKCVKMICTFSHRFKRWQPVGLL